MQQHLRTLAAALALAPVAALAQSTGTPTTTPSTTPKTTPATTATTSTTAPTTPTTATELASVPLDYARFQSTGRQVFDITTGPAGATGTSAPSFSSTLVMETQVEKDGIVLKDCWEIMGRTYNLTLRCDKAPLLPLTRGTIEMMREGTSHVASLAPENGVLKLTSGERTADVDFPAGTVMQAALFRIVTQLPTTPGRRFTFSGFTEPLEMRVSTPEVGQQFQVMCTGPQTISVGDKQVPCTKFTLNADETIELFVDGTAQLRKIVADKGATVMVLRGGVMAASEE